MKAIQVNASHCYEVRIGTGLLRSIGEQVLSVIQPRKACIISDSNVFPLYGQIAKNSLNLCGIDTVEFVIPAGEESKNAENYLLILNFLAENQLTRSDCIVALGGGVVGDLSGFAAATYLRGIAYIQVPTTLLAAVDSSVGGKTAIDLPAGKNLCGAFYQPRLVLCDIETLNTLPPEIYRDGCAEVIKYAILFDPELFSLLARAGADFPREDVISRCVELKRDVVSRDEFESGERMLLNLGHTVGHGIEKHSNYTVSHGNAVGTGMCIVTRMAESMNCCSEDTAQKIISLIRTFGLPTKTDIHPEALYEAALSDKKRSGDSVNLVVPYAIGDCRIRKTTLSELKSLIKAGM